VTIKQLRAALNDAEALTLELEAIIDPGSKQCRRSRDEVIEETIITLNRLIMLIEDFEIE
jgi:hypothetical protein